MNFLGAWRSLVARTVRVGEVPGSNPGAPIANRRQLPVHAHRLRRALSPLKRGAVIPITPGIEAPV